MILTEYIFGYKSLLVMMSMIMIFFMAVCVLRHNQFF